MYKRKLRNVFLVRGCEKTMWCQFSKLPVVYYKKCLVLQADGWKHFFSISLNRKLRYNECLLCKRKRRVEISCFCEEQLSSKRMALAEVMCFTRSSSSSFGGASLPRQMEGPRPRVYPFTTLATKLLGSDADCKGLQPASCFVI